MMKRTERDTELFNKASKSLHSFNYATVTLNGNPMFRLEPAPNDRIMIKRLKDGKSAPVVYTARNIDEAFIFMREEEQRERYGAD